MNRNATQTFKSPASGLAIFLVLVVTAPVMADKKDKLAFKTLQARGWKEVFSDSCSGNWRDKWFLDGQAAKVSNDKEAMTIDTADGYAVLWTKQSFQGDLRIEYDFKRADKTDKGVNIIYIQATGDGQNGCAEDISKWSQKRKNAAMRDYYMNMHTYHVSYAAYPKDYIRGRRYLPLKNKGLAGTAMTGAYDKTGLFDDNKWIHVTLIKEADQLWMEFKHPDKTLLCHFTNKKNGAIVKGRIGLRLMPGRMSQFKNFRVTSVPTASTPAVEPNWKTYCGKVGAAGWRCNVVQPDPKDAGPDGINLHDWDGDGDLDVFVNYEEGAYSRLYFNPGKEKVRDLWSDYIEFKHGKCEDSGIGDLDNDGDIDYIANGGWVYFNPGKKNLRDPSKWTKMTLFNKEARVPTVADIDGDGLNDLIVGARTWYKQPAEGKHEAKNWKSFALGKAAWPMNCIVYDMDKDGDSDIIVQDRRRETFWFVNAGKEHVTKPWARKTLYARKDGMFMAVGDVNGDKIDDFVIANQRGRNIHILLRTNKTGAPELKTIILPQPIGKTGAGGDFFPKGVAIMDLDGDPSKLEILIVPKSGDIWTATYSGDSTDAGNWKTRPIEIPGSATRKKMDNAFLGDIDGDGDIDIMTTEENGAWGVLWFENPARK